MDLEKIANLIQTKRKEKNLTQKQLADKLCVTEKAVSRWETGRGTPDISLLIPLSKELGVSISEIISGKEEQKNDTNIHEVIEYIDINKKHKNNKFLIIPIIIYIITLFLYLIYLKYEFNQNIKFSYYGEIIYNLLFGCSIIISNQLLANYYFDKVESQKRIKKITYIILLIIYVIFIFNYTIFNRYLYETRSNLIPLKTILEYVMHNQNYNTNTIIQNIFGNILIFMPIQYFIIKIGNLQKFKIVFIIDFCIVFSIELLQYITHTGIFDIDDIILNLLGMFIVFIGSIIFNNLKRDK